MSAIVEKPGVYSAPVLSYEEGILAKYSSPGLRRNVMTRYAKQFQLDDLKLPAAEIKELLARLYPEESPR